jgi:type I restriction enzyme M protein
MSPQANNPMRPKHLLQVFGAAKDKGRIYDPACGSGGSLPASRLCGVRFAEKDRAIAQGVVQSEKIVESHGGPGQRDSASLEGEATLPSLSAAKGNRANISIYGQDKWARRQRPFGLAKRARRVRLRGQQPKQSNATTRRLAVMNLALRGIEADFGPEHADTFRRDLHPDLRADYVLANPPFNDSDWFRKDDDVRWQPSGARSTAKGSPQGERGGVHQFGVPPKCNANFAWVQHFIHHLAPQGMAGFVLANGSMSSNQSGEGDIRRALIEADLVDCMVALPGQLFYSTQIPVCLWFLAKNKNADAKRGFRDRRKQTLFIDARKLGTLIDRVHRELTDADLEKITSTYHAWRGDSSLVVRASARSGSAKDGLKPELPTYADIPGFCKSATTAEIAAHGHVLTPGRYVGAEEVEDDGDPFEEKMPRLVAELHAQFAESAKLEAAIRANLKSLNFTT